VIDCSRYLLLIVKQAIKKFLEDNEFAQLQKFTLNDQDWNSLEVYNEVLAVCVPL
jgi:hypothetical protein